MLDLNLDEFFIQFGFKRLPLSLSQRAFELHLTKEKVTILVVIPSRATDYPHWVVMHSDELRKWSSGRFEKVQRSLPLELQDGLLFYVDQL